MDEARVLYLAKEKAELFDKEIKAVFSGETKNLHDAIHYHISEPGKRLRPLLAFMACEALGGSSEKIIPFAAACDILQHWILIHDDIEDGDEVRRGQQAVWKKYGLAHGINIGDFMCQKVYELVLRSKNYGVDDTTTLKLVKAVVSATIKTSEGQTLDINLRDDESPNEKDYMDMIIGKTAHYLTVPIVGGAIIAKREDLIDRIIEYGEAIGPAFQIRDDILDLTEGKGRDQIGRDIKEGKRSLLVVHCLSKCGESERNKLLEILKKPVDETSEEDIPFAKGLFEKHGSLEYAQDRCKELVQKAKKVAREMPPSLSEVLDYFADYLEKRKK